MDNNIKAVKKEIPQQLYYPYYYCNYPSHSYPHPNYPWNQGFNYQPNIVPFSYPNLQEEYYHKSEITQRSVPNNGHSIYDGVQGRKSAVIKVQNTEFSQPENVREIQKNHEKDRQKFGRNILSNIFHMAIKKILTKDFQARISVTISLYKMQLTFQEFHSKLDEKLKKFSGYISLKTIKKLLLGNPIGATKVDIEFRKLLRILIRTYLYTYHIPYMFSSGKIRKESRKLHFETIRKLNKRLIKF